jgi:hypothetical protein
MRFLPSDAGTNMLREFNPDVKVWRSLDKEKFDEGSDREGLPDC